MMKSAIEEAVRKFLQTSLEKIQSLYSEEDITDFYIRYDYEVNELSMKDDNDVVLSKQTLDLPIIEDMDISDEIENSDSDMDAEEELHRMLLSTLREELKSMHDAQLFDKVNVFKPFSFVFDADDEMDDLLLVDDESLIIGDDLLKDLDEDLDAFMEKLLGQN